MDKPQKTIEEKLLKQLKILNFWITTFGVLLLIALGIIGFFMYQTAMFVKKTSDNFSNFQQSTSQTLDVKTQICQGNDQLSQLLKSSGYC